MEGHQSERGEEIFKFSKIDRRSPIQNIKIAPYHNLLFLYANKYGFGTAFLIDEYHALTAAHNLFFGQHVFKEIYLYPYAQGFIETRDSKLNGANIIKMKDCRYPLEYIAYFKDHEKRQAYDYALIRFETPIIHKNYAKLLIDHTFDKSKVHMVEVAGFPGNRIIFKTNGDKEVYPYHHSDKLILQNDSIIQYEADTSEGQSGSPILYLYNNVPYVIGIHNRGIKEKIRANQGVFLQKKVGDNILAWMKEMYLPRPEMFIVGESGISNYSTLDLPSEQEQDMKKSWHYRTSQKIAKSFINNSNDELNWQILNDSCNCLRVNNQTLTNLTKGDDDNSIFAVTYSKIAITKNQKIKVKINNMSEQIFVGLIHEKGKRELFEENLSKGNFKKYILGYTNIRDPLYNYGRLYYNSKIYNKYEKADRKLFTKQNEEIEFLLEFDSSKLTVLIKGQIMMQEPILKDFLDENLYLYVILGESLDSIDVTRIDL